LAQPEIRDGRVSLRPENQGKKHRMIGEACRKNRDPLPTNWVVWGALEATPAGGASAAGTFWGVKKASKMHPSGYKCR